MLSKDLLNEWEARGKNGEEKRNRNMNMIKPYETETSIALKYDNVLAHGSNVSRKRKGISSSRGVKQRQTE